MAFPFYGADGTNGTVAVTKDLPTVVGTGTGWLANNAVPTAGGYAIKLPDGGIYGIKNCTGDGALTLCENYHGDTASGGAYYIMPLGEAIAQLLNQVSTLLNSSGYSQLAGLAPNSGDFIQYLGGTWTNRSPLQTLLNLLNSAGEVSIASAATCDIGAATSPKVQITGTTAITGFGNQPNAVRFVRFAAALTLTHNAASLILPFGVNITTAAGDTAIFISDGSGNWRCWSYQRSDGRMVNMASPSFSGSVQTSQSTGTAYKAGGGNGYVIIGDGTSSTEDVASFGSGFSSLNPFLGYGIKSTSAGLVSSYGGTLSRAYLTIGFGGLKYYRYASTWTAAVGTVASMPLHLAISDGGTVQFSQYGSGTLSTDSSGNVTASSDPSLKTRVGDFAAGLTEVRAIAADARFMGQYQWNENSGMERVSVYPGFFAYDDFPIPGAVHKDANQINTFNDRPVIMALVNAVDALAQALESANARIAALEAA